MPSKQYWFNSFWKKHQFKIIVIISILIICILACYNSEEGTYSTSYVYIPEKKHTNIPKESKGEKECRRVMELIFNRPFPNQRPLFLRNSVTGKPLEIDCCNLDMKLGVEYNGKQHYSYCPHFHKNFEAFRTQQYRDQMKYRLCSDNQFDLIVVPYSMPLDNIENYLRRELLSRNYI